MNRSGVRLPKAAPFHRWRHCHLSCWQMRRVPYARAGEIPRAAAGGVRVHVGPGDPDAERHSDRVVRDHPGDRHGQGRGSVIEMVTVTDGTTGVTCDSVGCRRDAASESSDPAFETQCHHLHVDRGVGSLRRRLGGRTRQGWLTTVAGGSGATRRTLSDRWRSVPSRRGGWVRRSRLGRW